MAKKRRSDERSDGGPGGLDRVFAALESAPAGLHDVAEPAARLPVGLPGPLIDFYARCDGARLFLDSVELAPSDEVEPRGERWQFGSLEGEDLLIDARGRIWRNDDSLDDLVCEGTRLDRWLAGVIDALAMLYDDDGEFAEGSFDDSGEISPAVGERQLRAQLRRDPGAPGPRWRLGHALLAQDSITEGRAELEEVVAKEPAFAWAWLDLARISERLGELPGAIDEARTAAEAAASQPHAAYFHAQLARIAGRAGDEATRAAAAGRAAELAPELKAAQLEGARASLAEGDAASARGLLDLLRAVWPRDLEVLELARRVEAGEN
ncbi:MAG TPA: tetratricopeptide repeat protein [Kofleriaceae bacterium]|nr:tetratricopeptide repeat protein [Kofleriaceae bacterium]